MSWAGGGWGGGGGDWGGGGAWGGGAKGGGWGGKGDSWGGGGGKSACGGKAKGGQKGSPKGGPKGGAAAPAGPVAEQPGPKKPGALNRWNSGGPQKSVASTATPAAAAPSVETLTVTGCKDATIGPIINGVFTRETENHSKPVYKKNVQVSGSDVRVYYWHDPDVSAFCGWWFGPAVGGDQVWCFHPSQTSMSPPEAGWKVPFNGAVDPLMRIKVTRVGPATPGVAPAAPPKAGGTWPSFSPPAQSPEESRKQEMEKQRLGIREKMIAEQKLREEAKQKMEEQKLKVAEAAKKQAEEAGEKRKAMEELNKKKREEAAMKMKADAEKKAQESKSTLVIRKAITKIKLATVENFAEYHLEFIGVVSEELQNVGAAKEALTKECDTELAKVRERVDKINGVKALIAELAGMIEECEAGIEQVKEALAPLENTTASSMGVVEKRMKAVDGAIDTVKAKMQECADFVDKRKDDLKDPGPRAGPQQTAIEKEGTAMLKRLSDCNMQLSGHVTQAQSCKEKALRYAKALEESEDAKRLFNKYSKGSGGVLARKDILAYSSAEFGFKLPEQAVDLIWRCNGDSEGVQLEGFRFLRVSIGVARERERDAVRRKDRAEKEQKVKELLGGVKEKAKEAAKAVDGADKELASVENHMKGLSSKAKGLPATEMDALAEETHGLIETAKARVDSVRDSVAATGEAHGGLDEVKAFVTTELKTPNVRLERMNSRVARVQTLLKNFREQIEKRLAAQLQQMRAAARTRIRQHQDAKELSMEDLYAAFDPEGAGEISEESFVAFFETAVSEGPAKEEKKEPEEKKEEEEKKAAEGDQEAAKDEADAEPKAAPPLARPKFAAKAKAKAEEPVELKPEGLARVFAALAKEDGEEKLTKQAFLRFNRLYYKVAKTTAITDGKSAKDATTIRKLVEGEVVQTLEGPVKDDSMDLLRIRGKVLSDGAEGWVSVAGNLGTTFLIEGGTSFKVVKETTLTECFEFDEVGTGAAPKKLQKADVLDVLDWPEREKTGALRMRCRLRRDGTTGFATVQGAGQTATVFCEVC